MYQECIFSLFREYVFIILTVFCEEKIMNNVLY